MSATDAPLVSRASRDTEGSGGARLLLSDVTIAGGLLNEARYALLHGYSASRGISRSS